MATSLAQEKTPSETIRLGADFTSSLLNGEAIIGGNVTVTCTNAITGASAPSILSGAPSISGNIVTQKVTAGSNGDVYTIKFSTGLTSFSLVYEAEINLVVTTSPSSGSVLASRDEVKRQLGITDSTDDQLIDDLLTSASAYIRRRTGRDFTLKQYSEAIRIEDDNVYKIRLNNYPVMSVSRIQIYDTPGETLWWDVTDTSQWDFLPEGYVWWHIDSQYAFIKEPGKNVITYVAGYPKIPEDVRKAAADLAVGFYRAIGREGLAEEKIGDYSYRTRKSSDFPPSLRREINEGFIEGVISRYQSHNLGFIDCDEDGYSDDY